MVRKISWVVVAACLFASCAQPSETSSEEDVAAIRAVIAEEVRAANAGDVEGFVAIFANNITVVPPNEPAVQGPAAVREWTQAFMETVSVEMAGYRDDEILVVGDVGLHYYSFEWTLTPKTEGEAFTEQGSGIHVFHRQADGSWKMSYDIWNGDAPLPPM
jgi:uncharacterized protein (TIGR02246 family)